MYVREAKATELDGIYAMGFDVWHDGLSLEDYLTDCRNSDEYQAGTWYVLTEDDQLVSSLIVYSGMFCLKESCFGVGSVATPPSYRGRGYASQLVSLVKMELFANHHCKAIYLHSDIGHQFYSKLGFVRIEGSNCMFITNGSANLDGSIPAYF